MITKKYFALIILIYICISFIIVKYLSNIPNNSIIIPPVYCLMITGHDKQRRKFALKSIQNFFEQSYYNKHLIILNQDETTLLNTQRDNVLEIKIDNYNKTLGELRNISLQLVPPNAIWTIWDDDDYRANKYIEIMINEMQKTNSDFLLFKNRIEFNLNNKFLFKIKLNSGLMTFFAKYNPFIQYEHIPTSEDKLVKEFALKHLKVHIYNNNPLLYIRAIHNNNTSIYVSHNKNFLKNTSNNKNYFEYDLTKQEKQHVNNIIYKYYK